VTVVDMLQVLGWSNGVLGWLDGFWDGGMGVKMVGWVLEWPESVMMMGQMLGWWDGCWDGRMGFGMVVGMLRW
jgi:hypothetical protein